MLPIHQCHVEGGSVPEIDKEEPFIVPDRGCIQSVHRQSLCDPGSEVPPTDSWRLSMLWGSFAADLSCERVVPAWYCDGLPGRRYRFTPGAYPGGKRNSPGFHRGCLTEPWEAFGSKCGKATWPQSHRRHRDKGRYP